MGNESTPLKVSGGYDSNLAGNIRLVLAEAHLAKALWSLHEANVLLNAPDGFEPFCNPLSDIQESLITAKDLYKGVQKQCLDIASRGRAACINNFRILINLTIFVLSPRSSRHRECRLVPS